MIILHFFSVIVGISAVVFLGFLVVDTLVQESHFIEKIVLGYILGLGILTLALFVGNIFGIPFELLPSSIILLALILISLIINLIVRRSQARKKESIGFSLKEDFINLTGYERIILLAILFLFLSSLALSLYWPIRAWDALVLYDYRAKTFVATGFMTDGIQRGYFFGYPLMTSLAHTWVYLLGGSNPLFLYSLMYISFTIAFYFSCLRFMNRTPALIASFLLATYRAYFSHSLTAYTNLPYTVYLVLGFTYLVVWVAEKKQNLSVILPALLIGISTWVRYVEPFWYTGIAIVLIYSIARRRFLPIIYYLFFSLIAQLPWDFFQQAFTSRRLPQEALVRATGLIINNFNLTRVFQVSQFTFNAAIKPWLLILLAMFLVFALALKLHRHATFPMVLIIVINLGLLTAGAYIASLSIKNWANISESVERLAMFYPALIIFYIFSTIFYKNFPLFSKHETARRVK